jgi:hypothetical protein
MALHDLFRPAGLKRVSPPAIAAHSSPILRVAPEIQQNPTGGRVATARYALLTVCRTSITASSTRSTCVSS